MNNERLGNILLGQGLIASQELEFCLSVQKNNGHQKLGQLLCHYNFADEITVTKAVASQVGWSFFDGEYIVDDSMTSIFGYEFFVSKRVFPLKGPNGPSFVFSQINDTFSTDQIIQKLGLKPLFYIGLDKSLDKALVKLNHKVGTPVTDREDISDDLNVWLDNAIKKAIEMSASDVHIEPSQKVIEIRFRVDGLLIFIETLPLKVLSRIVNIVFHKADVTISDFSHFHDAKFVFSHINRSIDVRVSHVPSVNGSALVLRLLDKGKTAMKLSELGYGPRSLRLIEENLTRPEGIMLVVGPTGCGKTTTLYAVLNQLKSIDTKVVTIEDPVEIYLPLMTQVQINEKSGIGFAQTVRAFLRHDPDIILIGEIRDEQTAQEALRMAMTGHRVLTTLHTNRALDAIWRLNDLGLPLPILADHVSMIVAQRLVRRLCPYCKRKIKVSRANLLHVQAKYLDQLEQEAFIPQGCLLCRNGFIGQVILSEVLPFNDAISEFVTKGDLINLRNFLKDGRMPTMVDDARRLVAEGLTSIDEILRVIG